MKEPGAGSAGHQDLVHLVRGEGCAAHLAFAELPEVAGTISGDDTVFIAVREPATALSLVDRLSALDRGAQP